MTLSSTLDPAVRTSQRVGALLKGRVAVISGAGRDRGIGKATAKLFEAHGASVALLDLDEAEVLAAAAVLRPAAATPSASPAMSPVPIPAGRRSTACWRGRQARAGSTSSSTMPASPSEGGSRTSPPMTTAASPMSSSRAPCNCRRPCCRRCDHSGAEASSASRRCRRSKAAACSAARIIAPPRPACSGWSGRWRANWARKVSGPMRSRPA